MHFLNILKLVSREFKKEIRFAIKIKHPSKNVIKVIVINFQDTEITI